MAAAAGSLSRASTVSRHSAIVRVTHWITTLCFFALLVSGVEILISHPRFYWGEAGNVLTPTLFKMPIPASRSHRADRLRVRAAGPERLEPLSPFSSRVAGRFDRVALCRSSACSRDISVGDLLPSAARFIVAELSRSVDRESCAIQAAGRRRSRSYNVLQRLIVPLGDLRAVSAGDLDGPGDVSRVRIRVSFRRYRIRRATIRAHHPFLRIYFPGAVPAGTRRDDFSGRILKPHARHDHGRATRERVRNTHEQALATQN